MSKTNGKSNGVKVFSSFDLSDVKKRPTSHYPAPRKEREFKPCHNGHTDGPHHNCGYVNAINRLIPAAERMANRRFIDYVEEYDGRLSPSEARAVWSKLFMEEMQIDAEAAGLRRGIARA